jgi:hypothetical protein
MNKPPIQNPFEDPPIEKRPAAPMIGRDAIRIARQLAAAANAGRSSYTMGMLIIVTISCAAILGVCGTSLRNILSGDGVQRESIGYIVAGLVVGIPFGIIVALFVRISTPTIFLGGMMGGLVGAITTPAALNAEESPTRALVAAAIIGPALILAVSYVFALLSRRTHSPHQPTASSPWDPPMMTALPGAKVSPFRDTDDQIEVIEERTAIS